MFVEFAFLLRVALIATGVLYEWLFNIALVSDVVVI